MELAQLLAWIVGANTVINFATTAYTLLSTRATKALKALEALDARISAMSDDRQRTADAVINRFQLAENRLLKIEADMPDRNQAHDLAMAIEKMSGLIGAMDARLSGRIETLDERLKPVDQLGRRLQEFLVRQAERQDDR